MYDKEAVGLPPPREIFHSPGNRDHGQRVDDGQMKIPLFPAARFLAEVATRVILPFVRTDVKRALQFQTEEKFHDEAT